MDWSRVKTILICALLLANAIIGLFIIYDNRAEKVLDETSRLGLINDVLQRQGVSNHVDQPPDVRSMPQLTMSYQSYDLATVASQLLARGYVQADEQYGDDTYDISLRDQELIIARKPATMPDGAVSSQDVEQRIVTLFDVLGFAEDYQLISRQQQNEHIELIYGQVYNEYFIDGSQMKVVIDQGYLQLIRRHWMTVQVIDQVNQPIISYHEALLGATQQLVVRQPVAIQDIALGYRLEKSILGADIQSGDASPYYRLDLSDNQYVFIPAQGSLEQFSDLNQQ